MIDIPSNAYHETGTLSSKELRSFSKSLERAISSRQFLSTFYENFIQSSEEIATFFVHVDMPELQDKLSKTLTLMLLANIEPERVDEHLKKLGQYHQELSIPKYLYSAWRDSLIRALDSNDLEFSPELHTIWLKATNVAISKMHEGYQ